MGEPTGESRVVYRLADLGMDLFSVHPRSDRGEGYPLGLEDRLVLTALFRGCLAEEEGACNVGVVTPVPGAVVGQEEIPLL